MSRVFAAVEVDDCEEVKSLVYYIQDYLKKGKQNILFVTDDRFHVFKAGKKLVLCRSVGKPIFAYPGIIGVFGFFVLQWFFGLGWWHVFPAILTATQYFLTDSFLHFAFKTALKKRKYKGGMKKLEASQVLDSVVSGEYVRL